MTMTEAEQMIRMGSNIDADVWNTVVDAMRYGSAMQLAVVNILKILYARVMDGAKIELNLKKAAKDYSKVIDKNSFNSIITQYFSDDILKRVIGK